MSKSILAPESPARISRHTMRGAAEFPPRIHRVKTRWATRPSVVLAPAHADVGAGLVAGDGAQGEALLEAPLQHDLPAGALQVLLHADIEIAPHLLADHDR